MLFLSVIVAGFWLILCIAVTALGGSSIFYIDDASLFPLMLIIFILYMSLTDLRFPQSGKSELHTSEKDLAYAEKAKMYRNRGMLFLTAIIPESFLCFCFSPIFKIILAIVVLTSSLGLSIAVGHLSIKKDVDARYKREMEELREQQQKEQSGKW